MHRIRTPFQLAVCLFAATVVLAASQSTPPNQASGNTKNDSNQSKQTATLKGKVTNAVTNDALRKVTLILTKTSGGGITKADTDDKGEFSFQDIEPGRYYLFAERTGFTRQAYGARGNALVGVGLSFSAGQEVKDIVFKLQPNSVISGKVLDADGEPIPQTMVMALRVMYQRGKKQLLPLSTSMTNDLGEYRLANLKAGRYSVSATPMNVGIGVAGTSNQPPSDRPEHSNVTTFYPGVREKELASPIEVGVGAEARGMDIRMVQVDTVRVKGKLDIPSGKQAIVYLTPKGAGVSGLISRIQTMAVAQQDGTFEIKGVSPGSYVLSATGIDGLSSLGVPQAVEVADKHISGLVLPASGNGELSGTFRIEDKLTANVKDIQVTIEPQEIFSVSPPKVAVGDDGKFTLKDVPPDRYLVHHTGGAESLYMKSVRYNGLEVGDDGLDLSGGVKGSVDILMSDKGGQVDGSVVGDDGNPVSGVTVVLIPDSRRFSLFKEMTTDQRGAFSFKGITPGDYKLLAWEDIDTGAYQDPEFLKQFVGKSESVSLRESDRKVVSLKMIPIESASTHKL